MEDFEFEPESQDDGDIVLPGEQPIEETHSESPETEEHREEPSSEEEAPTEKVAKDNPAWNPILGKVPEAFHPHLKEHLSKFDRTIQEVSESYAPWKQFAERSVTPDQAAQALQLMQLINTNPRGVWEFLGNQYNYAQAVQQQANSQQQANQTEETLELGEDQPDIFKDPRVQQLANQAAFSAQAVQQMQEQAIRQQASQKADAELAAIQGHKEYKNIPTDVLIQTALGRAYQRQAQTGREVEADLMEAAKILWDSGAYRPVVRRPAPPNVSGRRGTTIAAEADPLADIGKMSRSSRSALVAQMMRQAENNE